MRPAAPRRSASARRARRLTVAVALVAALSLAGCGGADASEADLDRLEQAFASADVALGTEVFDDSCSVCHGSDGSGGVGAALGGVDERLSVRNHLSVVWTGRGSMPPFGGILTDAEIAAVVAYQRSTFGTE
ncbi:MAG: c-type cytochrome [Acidimicrobiales bacterium]|nr:c-type cytochrome [Acidimicrobiaceae bacterium]MYA81394.1 c-type cytochrome [Acidimicrobiales bacterium]MYH74446.1 c-type cytochrome [Acidimicrobiales bacterium]MYK72114.1 c-type cytochrome [Acidimicrobiales bacterium]